MDAFLPNAQVLLEAMMLTPARLRSGTRAAVPLSVVRAILASAAAALPFNEEFYLKTYSDVAEAHRSGQIRDLHAHFVASGFLEGRLGSEPGLDEQFYRRAYPDVATAIAKGELKSGYEHYIKAGAREGRSPNPAHLRAMKQWEEASSKTET
jgi:hypothetical protein